MSRDQRVFDAVPTSALTARRFVTAALRTEGAHESAVKKLTLVASELVSNVIEHGLCVEVTVIVDCSDPAWWAIEVRGGRSLSDELAEPSGWGFPAADDATGRGLAIAREIMDEIRVRGREGELSISGRVHRRV
jgi:anti-sigma regulatory factor (Ser/Thr protein kinase)